MLNEMEWETMDNIRRLHHAVDRGVDEVSQSYNDRLQCRSGCHGCCLDGITVFQIEADLIREQASTDLRGASPSPAGCAFLSSDGRCRIYHARPYVCRTQGLPLRWHTDLDEELRDICALNDEVDIMALSPDDCWTLGPIEYQLQRIQRAKYQALQRIGLRELFMEISSDEP